jgi:hypothetical protein
MSEDDVVGVADYEGAAAGWGALKASLNAHISTSGVENCMPVAARRLERITE